MSTRQRSDSKLDESRINDYVRSCVNFATNISFVDVETYEKQDSVSPHVLIVGTPDQLKDSGVAKLPVHVPAVAAMIQKMDGKPKTFASFVDTPAQQLVRVTVAGIPAEASRNNCPYRADSISAAVTEAVGHADGEEKPENRAMDIIVRTASGSECAVANAIARAVTHSFSLIDDAIKNAFTSKHIRVNVIFAHRNIFTREPIAIGNGQSRVITAEELVAQCTSVQLCQRLFDTPTNYLDTVVYAEIAEAYGKALGVDVAILKGEALREAGYGGIYSVGMGAQYPPFLVTLHYENKDAAAADTKNIALVGKGMVYDCGGLAIKPATGMVNMKSDMGGSAAVFGGFIAVVRSIKANPSAYKHIKHLSVTLCLAENAIGPNAYRNGDIIVMKSGKSVEVINTDAEGRIVLGDGVYYASGEQSFKPDILLDMATLTGAQGIATGTKHAALYISDGATEDRVMDAGRQSGDTCFPVLYSPEHHKPQYKSPCADLRNLMHVGTDGGVSCGGYFIEANLHKDYKGVYAHVDLAFPSFNEKGGTGFGVSLITEYVRTV